jgi:hypothetical protein
MSFHNISFLESQSQSVENGINDTINNNQAANTDFKVKEPLKSPDNKIIIQKVESVKLEIIKTHFVPERRISSLFQNVGSNEDTSQPQSQFEHSEQKNTALNHEIQTDVVKKPPDDVQNNGDFSSHSSVKLLSTKIPENSCNKSVPLKMIRTIKVPKPKPNLLHRIHRVQTTKSPEPAFDSSSVKIEVLHPLITMTEENQVEDDVMEVSVLSNSSEQIERTEPDFIGFGHIATIKGSNIGLWKEVLEQLPDKGLENPTKRLKVSTLLRNTSSPQQRFDTNTLGSSQQITKLSTKRPESGKSEFMMSSTSKKYLDILSKTEPKSPQSPSLPKESAGQQRNADISEEIITSLSKAASPVKVTLPSSKTAPLKMDVDEDIVTENSSITSLSLTFQKTSQAKIDPIELIPSTSKELHHHERNLEAKVTNSDWMEDILTVIGSSRIGKIDESLKEIPNLITGNFSAIETENVEFKLIIKHLLRKLKVESIMDTVNFSPNNGLMRKGLNDFSFTLYFLQ